MFLLEAMDVARRLGVGPARVTAMARQGTLKPYATTPRGLRLFTDAEVERVRQLRALTPTARVKGTGSR